MFFTIFREHPMAVVVDFSTISEMFVGITSKFADEKRPMLMHKVDGAYKGISYSEYRRKVELFALGLTSLGVQQGDRLSIIAENRPEWVRLNSSTTTRA